MATPTEQIVGLIPVAVGTKILLDVTDRTYGRPVRQKRRRPLYSL